MSRGPGKWQRLILQTLEAKPRFCVTDLLPDGYTRSEYVALLRAANRLAASGRIEFALVYFRGPRRQPVAARVGANLGTRAHLPPAFDFVDLLNVREPVYPVNRKK